MSENIEAPVSTSLAPIDDLLALVPAIKAAKDRQRLGNALMKATATATRLADVPTQLEGLAVLLEALETDKTVLKNEISATLGVMAGMARRLAGELSSEDLENINGQGLVQLPLQVEKVERQIELVWRSEINRTLGGQAALGLVLSAISGVQALGKEITGLAARADKLSDSSIAAAKRVAERDALLKEGDALEQKIRSAGIEPAIAKFLVQAATGTVRLSQLDDATFAWIRDNGADDLFQISARGQ